MKSMSLNSSHPPYLSFYHWLMTFRHQDNAISDLARDAETDDYEFPKEAKSREEIYNYLVHKNASGNCLHTFDISWKTYIRDGGA